MSKVGFHFTGGPSKEDLKLSLFNGNQLKEPSVTFGGNIHGAKNLVCVSSVQREDGSYESWNIKGTLDGEKVMIYYRTDKRTGTVSYT